MENQTHQSKKLEMLGVSDTDLSDDEDGDYMVRCPSCGFTKKNLDRDTAASMSHKSGCPDCGRPHDELGAGEGEDPEPLTAVGKPLAFSPMP